jgi:RimJ/RimL family protein N-acetyltransferase
VANGPHIEGDRVKLGPFDGAFWTIGLLWYNDPVIVDLTSDDPSELTEDQFRQTIETDLHHDGSVVFGISDVSDRPIGIGILRNLDPVHRGCDLHITLGPEDARGQGLGAEAIALMRDHAFGLGMHKVMSTPFSKNPRMIRCLEKCGFEHEGVLRDALLQGETFIDVTLMSAINPSEGGD